MAEVEGGFRAHSERFAHTHPMHIPSSQQELA